MKKIRKNNYIRIRNSIIEENIRIELEKFLNEKRNIHEGILSDGYNFLRKISKSTLRILWEATKFILKNIKEFFKKISIVFKEIIKEYKKGDKTLYFLTISVAALSLYLVTNMDKIKVNQVEKKIIEKIKESKDTMIIPFKDKEKIERLCKLGEFKVFALETEDNYLCLPLEDEKSFKALKVSNYYDLHFDITNEESSQILDMLVEFKEKGTTKFTKKIGNTPEFTYKIVEPHSGNWAGRHTPWWDIKIVKHPLLTMYSIFVHEFIHYKDHIINKDKFNNRDIGEITKRLSKVFEKNQIVTYEEISNAIGVKDKSVTRYIVSILQKSKVIDYIDNNFSKVKIKNMHGYESDHGHEDTHYFLSERELNTHASNVIIDSLIEFKNLKIKNIIDPLYIINTYKKNSGNDDIVLFNNDQIKRMIKGYEKHKNDENFRKELNEFLHWIWKSENSTNFYEDMKNNETEEQKEIYNKFIDSPLLKMMEYTSSENQEKTNFLSKIANANNNKNVNYTLQDILKNTESAGITDALLDLQKHDASYQKKLILLKNIKEKVNYLFNELKKENKYEFNDKEEEERFYQDLLQNYTKKVFEKLKNYEENIEKNKEAYNKLKENILREYVRQLII